MMREISFINVKTQNGSKTKKAQISALVMFVWSW